MYIRYYNKSEIKSVSELAECTKLFSEDEVVPEGYAPFYTIVYARSTGNDVVAFDEPELVTCGETFYKAIQYKLPSKNSSVFDEGILASKYFLEQILDPSEVNKPTLPLKSFPLEVGCKYIEDVGVCLIMCVVISQDYFDELRLKDNYSKVKFDRQRFMSKDSLTPEVIKTFTIIRSGH